MQEAVRTEIVKLLDNGIIYPISDSQWVSPIYAVPQESRFYCGRECQERISIDSSSNEDTSLY